MSHHTRQRCSQNATCANGDRKRRETDQAGWKPVHEIKYKLQFSMGGLFAPGFSVRTGFPSLQSDTAELLALTPRFEH